MKRVSLSGLEKTVQQVWDWYEVQSTISSQCKGRVIESIRRGTPAPYPSLDGLSLDEVDDFFDELDDAAMLDLMAAAEAAIRLDYLDRVYKRRKDPLSRAFRRLYQHQGNGVGLEEHILASWKAEAHDAPTRSAIGDFSGALNLRHWLAHGRYYEPRLGHDYSPLDIYSMVVDLLSSLGILLQPQTVEGK